MVGNVQAMLEYSDSSTRCITPMSSDMC